VSASSRPDFNFSPPAFEPLTDYDAVMAFEMFLGRNPESAAVIDFHKSQSFPNMMAGCLASSEFADNVIRPMRAAQPILRGDYRGKPSQEQLGWLARFVAFDEAEMAQLTAAKDWGEFFLALHRIGGVDLLADMPPQPEPEAPAATDDIDTILGRLGQVREILAELEGAVQALRK
jgi:hypothetical protein